MWGEKTHKNKIIFTMRYTQDEVRVLDSLCVNVMELIQTRISGEDDELARLTGLQFGVSTEPEEKTLARLLPNFIHKDDDESEEEASHRREENSVLRSLHEPEIVDAKVAALRAIKASLPTKGGDVKLTHEAALEWMRGINDIRLVLGVLLGFDNSRENTPPTGHNLQMHYQIYQWLSTIVDLIVEALMDA